MQKIAEKVKEPAKTVTLKDTDTLVTEIDTLIDTINTQIQTNNDIVATKHDKQLECLKMVWEEIAFILDSDIKAYKKSKKDIEDAVKKLENDYRSQFQGDQYEGHS